MPRSVTKAIARTRMQYLGEPRAAALDAVPRDGSLGAQLVITGNPSGTWDGKSRPSPRWDFHPVNRPFTRDERSRLEAVPDMCEDIERLLAGLTCRIAAQDAGGRWAIGNWFSDPLTRPSRLRDPGGDRYEKQLQGSGREWTFRWNGFPYVEDVAASLTAPPVGIAGALARDAGDHFEVLLGRATLRLVGQRALARQEPEVAP